MAKWIDIAGKNLKTLFRDKKAAVFTILIPILFYCIMGLIFGSPSNTTTAYVYEIGWVDLDSSLSYSPTKNVDFLYDQIGSLDAFTLKNYSTQQSAQTALQNKEIEAFIVFPEGYELYLNGTGSSSSANFTLYYLESTSTVTKTIIGSTLVGIIDGIVNNNPSAVRISYDEQNVSGESINQLTQSAPGYLMYGILSALTSAVILITTEHKEGMLKRLESSQMQPKDMVFGHLLSNTVIILLQFCIGVAVLSLFGFNPNFNDILSLLLGTLVTVVLLSVFQNGLALVSSALLKTPESAGGGVWIILIPLMTFSGAFFPLEFIVPGIIPYVGWIPTRIAVVLFQDIFVNAVPIWETSILLNFLWLGLEGGLLVVIGTKLYRKFVRS